MAVVRTGRMASYPAAPPELLLYKSKSGADRVSFAKWPTSDVSRFAAVATARQKSRNKGSSESQRAAVKVDVVALSRK